MAEVKIRRALLSVYDKTGLVDFARALHDEFGIEIVSTGGTAKALREADIPVTLVEGITGFPELLDGRVKTLHPKIHAAILADRGNPEHVRQLKETGIEPIDMVVVNLYPFEQTIARPDCTFEQAIEMIDIGGPGLLRAVAKNHEHVVCVGSPRWYEGVLKNLRKDGGSTELAYRRELACSAYRITYRYDQEIWLWLRQYVPWTRVYESVPFGERRFWPAKLQSRLRYGENPHQDASSYRLDDPPEELNLLDATVLATQELSFNNYADASAALDLCAELTRGLGEGPRGLKPAAPTTTGASDEQQTRPREEEPRASARAAARASQQAVVAEVYREPDPASPAWLLTWTTYGTWLPGDERGFVSRRPDANGAHIIHNLPGTPYDADEPELKAAAREQMQGPPVGLLQAQATVVVAAVEEVARSHQINLLAISAMPDHVHVLCQAAQTGSELLQLFKGVAARRLNQQFTLTGAPRWWTKSGSERCLQKRVDLEPAVRYVCDQHGALVVRSFLQTIAGSAVGEREAARAEARGSSSSPQRGVPTVCFIKHTNACGVAVHTDPLEAYRKAYLGDPNAALGGILAVNFAVDAAFADAVMETYPRWGKAAGAGGYFVEVWLAPSFTDDAVNVIRTKKEWGQRVRLLAVGDMSVPPDPHELDFKKIAGGMLVQTRDLVGLHEAQWQVVTQRPPTEAEISDLCLAWLVAKHTKSNAVSICKDGLLIGNGAGQMSRVMSCRVATWLARDNRHDLHGAVAASDGFFPFRDGPDLLADAGITALVQPGGSKRDAEVIKACNERGLAMIFTGTRHFKH